MIKCNACGSDIEEDQHCCPKCGTRLVKPSETDMENGFAPYVNSEPLPEYPHVPSEEEIADSLVGVKDTMLLREYILMYLVTFVPIINVFMLCVWIFGKETGVSKRNFAKYMVITATAKFVLFLIFMTVFWWLTSSVMSGKI